MIGFTEAVRTRILLLDGAMGTELQEAGLPPGTAPEAWNLSEPARVEAVHRAYLDAGAEILETNTFGANPLKLAHYGLTGEAGPLNQAGVELARRAASGRAWVVGSVGPTGRLLAPLGDLDPQEALEAYALQAEALAAAGADAINIETMSDLVEMRLALLAAFKTGLPVMAEFVFERNGRTLFGSPPEVIGAFLAGFPILAAGTNCGLTPELLPPILKGLRKTWHGPLIVQPNAGRAGDYLGDFEFAATAASLVSQGATILGGCCGTKPAHIGRLRAELAPCRAVPPSMGETAPLLASRTEVRSIPALPAGAMVPVRDERQDLFAEISSYQDDEVIVFDLTVAEMPHHRLGQVLAGLWPALRPPVIFYASDQEMLAAAILSYPGRPGAAGDPSLAGKARELGALWLA